MIIHNQFFLECENMTNSKSKKDYHPEFGSILRKFREEYDVSAILLAESVGVHKYPYQIISSWETGKREPSLVQLCKIAQFFGTSTDVLLGRKPITPYNDLTMFLMRNQVTEEQEKKLLKVITAVLNLDND